MTIVIKTLNKNEKYNKKFHLKTNTQQISYGKYVMKDIFLVGDYI